LLASAASSSGDSVPASAEAIEIASLTCAELADLARQRIPRGFGATRALYRSALATARFEPEAHGLGAEACARWREHFQLSLPEVVRTQQEDSESGLTAKVVLRLHDGLECESVLLPMGERATLCISSQVGCKMGCRFCETGRMGLLRNLTTAEILGQLLCARHVLGWQFRNVVFMGMGEALDNLEHVLPALRVMTDGAGYSLAQEHITVCTVGRTDGIARLAAAGFRRLNLSVSLNAARDELRSQLMPVNRRTPLAELQAALIGYRPRANFALGVNYCLMPGINDQRQDAAEIARFCAPLGRVMVNVIPYNPGNAPIAGAPDEAAVESFIGWLRDEGLPVRRRITKGRSVMAACGQLGNVELRRSRRAS
jgi:23S rRNA (adenine2503-C2)-methyltransferase